MPHNEPYHHAAVTHFLDDLPPNYVDWLWPNRIPLGQLTLLIGDPGVGKSLLAADLAARISSALPWPDRPAAEEPPATPPDPLPPLEQLTDADLRRRWPPIRGFMNDALSPAGVVFASPEDRTAGALQSRLAAAGADLCRISTLDGVLDPEDVIPSPRIPSPKSLNPPTPKSLPLALPTHFHALEQAIREHDHPRLVVLDPLQALLAPDAHGNPDTLVRLLSGLADIARRRHVAILAVGHLIKAASYRLLYRVRGSLSFVAAARSVLLVTADPDRPDRRVLSSLKTVFGPTPPPLSFRIVAGSETSSEISSLRSANPEPSNLKSPALAASNPPAPPPSGLSNLKFDFSEFSRLRPPPSETSNLISAIPEAPNLRSSGSEISNLKSAIPDPSNPTSSGSEISNLRFVIHDPPNPKPPASFQPAPHLVWDTPDATRPWEFRADLLDGRPESYCALSDACDWLWTYLAAGPKPARDLLADSHQAALGIDTLRRAKRLLAVRSTRNPSAPGWLWSLPPNDAPP